MSNEENLVPQEDLPDNLVPASDLPEHVPAASNEAPYMHPLMGAMAGAEIGGKYVAPAVGSAYALGAANKGINALEKIAAAKKEVPTVAPPSGIVSEHGFHPGAASNAAFNEEQRLANTLQSQLHNKPAPGFQIEGNRRIYTPTNFAQPVKAAEKIAETPVSQIRAILDELKGGASKIGKHIVPTGAVGKLVNTALPVASLAGAGAEAADAFNRYQRGDTRGAVIGGIGALGSAASAIPHPLTRAIGTGVALGAPALNAAIDYVSHPQQHAAGGSIKPILHSPVKPDLLMQQIRAAHIVR